MGTTKFTLLLLIVLINAVCFGVARPNRDTAATNPIFAPNPPARGCSFDLPLPPVCGSDGRIYKNIAELQCAAVTIIGLRAKELLTDCLNLGNLGQPGNQNNPLNLDALKRIIENLLKFLNLGGNTTPGNPGIPLNIEYLKKILEDLTKLLNLGSLGNLLSLGGLGNLLNLGGLGNLGGIGNIG